MKARSNKFVFDYEDPMKPKRNVPKILFWCSFLLYLAVLIYGIVNGIDGAIHGSTFLFGKTYGTKAFVNEFLFTIIAFIFKFPVVPACFLFQICYLLRTQFDLIRRMPFWLYLVGCGLLGALAFTPILRVWL